MGGMTRKGPVDLSGMDRRSFEALNPKTRVELLCRLHALAIEQVSRCRQFWSFRIPGAQALGELPHRAFSDVMESVRNFV